MDAFVCVALIAIGYIVGVNSKPINFTMVNDSGPQPYPPMPQNAYPNDIMN